MQTLSYPYFWTRVSHRTKKGICFFLGGRGGGGGGGVGGWSKWIVFTMNPNFKIKRLFFSWGAGGGGGGGGGGGVCGTGTRVSELVLQRIQI